MGIRPIALASAVVFAGAAIAQDTEDKLQIDGQSFVTETSAPAHLDNLSTIYSGWLFRTDETQALQLDDFDNPAQWRIPPGTALCGGCFLVIWLDAVALSVAAAAGIAVAAETGADLWVQVVVGVTTSLRMKR